MSSLSRLGLGLYGLLPDYRDVCPLCGGRDCAVRHGLYYRGLVDREGRVYRRFPVARFRCRRRGPKPARDVTFSVLPLQAVARRRLSVGLMQWLVELATEGKKTISRVLDEAARINRRKPLLLDELTIQRLLVLFAALYGRMLSFPVPGWELSPDLGTVREQARAAAVVLAPRCRGSPDRSSAVSPPLPGNDQPPGGMEPADILETSGPSRAGPEELVEAFHRRYFPLLLLDLRLRSRPKSRRRQVGDAAPGA